jgi:hypothetical protein
MTDSDRLVGSWRLVSLENAGRAAVERPEADGLIIYAADGYMSALIISPGEREEGSSDYHAYFGTYSVDEAAVSVTHHRIANTHAGAPADVERRYLFVSDDVLELTPLNHQGVRLTFHRAGR